MDWIWYLMSLILYWVIRGNSQEPCYGFLTFFNVEANPLYDKGNMAYVTSYI